MYKKQILLNKIKMIAGDKLSPDEKSIIGNLLKANPFNKAHQNQLLALKRKYLRKPHKMQNFIDRFLTKQLPTDNQIVIIIAHDTPNPDFEVEAVWRKFKPENYPSDRQPAEGFLGYFETKRFNYNVWKQNEYEIRYWKPISNEDIPDNSG